MYFFTGTLIDFFDNAFTSSQNLTEVTCCGPDETTINVTCGQGASCAGQCSAVGAMLCPSQICTDDPKTCELDFNDNRNEDENGEQQTGGSGSVATLSSHQLNWCVPDGCRVRKRKECCYNRNCLRDAVRRKACDWMSVLTGIHYQLL